jgi:hypothetical protein
VFCRSTPQELLVDCVLQFSYAVFTCCNIPRLKHYSLIDRVLYLFYDSTGTLHYVSVCPHALRWHHSTAAHHSIGYQYQIPPVTCLPVSYLGEGSREFNNLRKHLTFFRKCSEMDLSSVSGLVSKYSVE